ncbi:MAG: zinc-binding protein [Nitrospirae bacterium]|nr:MAG: zinc-binding protein [Nitrospirota bacterium]
MNEIKLLISVCCFCLVLSTASCRKQPEQPAGAEKKRLVVVTSLFPVYDFARQVAGPRADVNLLLPPGMETHSFELRPGDLLRLNRADIFFYTNKAMEPWVADIQKGISSKDLLVINSGEAVTLQEGSEEGHDTEIKGHGRHGLDPHIWLDPDNAVSMIEKIRDGYILKDPAGKEAYQKNASDYIAKLRLLDRSYREGLAGCSKRVMVTGGHGTFGYLARRYGLGYVSAYGLAPNAEPAPGSLIRVTAALKKNGLKHIYFEELMTPRVAEMIGRETGAELLLLHGIHNISRDDFDQGVTFLFLMEKNLEQLRKGLQCSQN